jgi:hypothetical protein
LGHSQIPESVTKIEAAMQEMMASMAEGWGKTWKNLEKQWISITDLNGTLPIKQARGLLIQGWHYIYGLWIPIYILYGWDFIFIFIIYLWISKGGYTYIIIYTHGLWFMDIYGYMIYLP